MQKVENNRVENNLENNLREVKDKLAGDQNMLLNAFRLETFYKKYRIYIFIIIAAIVVFGIYKGFSYYSNLNHKEKLHNILNELSQKDLDSTKKNELLSQLKSQDSILYDFYMYDTLHNLSVLELKQEENLNTLKQLIDSKDPLIAALSAYQYAAITEDVSLLQSYNFGSLEILKDRASLLAAYLYLKKNDIAKSRELLNGIKQRKDNEHIFRLAKLLKHYGVDILESTESKKDLKSSSLYFGKFIDFS